MRKSKQTFVVIKVETEDKHLFNKVRKVIQEHILSDASYSVYSNFSFSPEPRKPGTHRSVIHITKTYQRAIAKSNGGDYGEN